MATTVMIDIDDDLQDRITRAAQLRGVTSSRYILDVLASHVRSEPPTGVDSDRPGAAADTPDLSPFERRVLVQLHRLVLASKGDLGDSSYDKDDEVQGIRILESGFVGDYSEEFAGIVPPMSQAECEVVWDILDMFRIIGASVRALDGGWKQIGVDERYGTFQGFDGNHPVESRLLIYARHLVQHDRWTEQADVVLEETGDAQREMLPAYRAMLRAFKPFWSEAVGSGVRRHLSEEQIRRVVESVPDMRHADT